MQRQNFSSLIRVPIVLCLSLLVVMLGGLLKPEAAVQTVSFGAKTDFGTGSNPVSATATTAAQFSQQGPKLVGTGAVGTAKQGESVCLSADGNTAIVGGDQDNSGAGAAWVWTRSGGVWTQQGTKLVGSGAAGGAQQGFSVSLSADGNTAIVGGVNDNNVPGGGGAAWVWTRSGGVWTQQGTKLVGSGAAGNAFQGWSVSLSNDGNTAIVGGVGDNSHAGAAWVWTRSGGVWTQQGTKLVGSDAVGAGWQGFSVSLSADGNTAIVGGFQDNSGNGAAWVWTRSGGVWTQQGAKLVGSGAVGTAAQGSSVSISADGNTAIVGGGGDNSSNGAAWVWTRSGGVWTQQGTKLVGSGTVNANQGFSVSLSADGNTAIVGGGCECENSAAVAAWVWARSGGVWTQQGTKLVGSGAVGIAPNGGRVSLSADGNTAIVGGPADNNNVGAAWVFSASQCGTGTFGAKTDFGTGINPYSVAVGDFNGDAKLDLAVANNGSNNVSILLGTGTGSLGAKTDFGTGTRPESVAVGDFNGDGKIDLAVANQGSQSISILLGTGAGSFGAKTDFGTGFGPVSVAVADFNGDGKLDLAAANSSDDTVSILLGTGAGSFGAKTDFGTGHIPLSVAVGDFNGDGKLDLSVPSANDDTVSILLGTGTGTFAPKTDFGTGRQAQSVAVGDFNGDGKLDLAVANFFGATVSILLGTGTGTFGTKTDFATCCFPPSVAVGDFNGDGRLDLAVANQFSLTISILLGSGTGSFGAKTDFGTGSVPTSVAVGDFNGDSKLDLAASNYGSNTVSILLNTCGTPPSITAISPAAPVRSSTDQSVVVTGSTFQPNLTVAVTFPSGASTTLSGAQIQNVTSNSFTMLTTLNASGSWSLRVNNPDGGQSNTFSFNVGSGPLISSISPPSPVGSPTSQDVTIYGTNIDVNSTVTFTPPNGNALTVKGKLVTQDGSKNGKLAPLFITPVIFNVPGIWRLHITNPSGGGQSNTLSCTVRAPAPTINNINPDPVTAGVVTTLIVTGSNFLSGFSASVTTPNGTFNIASAGLNLISSGEVGVQVTMCGTPPYTATLRITNPTGGSATKSFQVTGASVACAPLYGTIGIQDGSLQSDQPPKWKLNGSGVGGVLSLTVTATPSTGGSPIPAQMNGSEYSFPSLPSGTYILSAELRYKDNITVNNRAGLSENGCDKPAGSILAKTSRLTINNVQAPSSSPKHIYFKPPLAMIHGINSCYQKWYGADSVQHWDRAARDLGFVTFTPNYHFDGGSFYPWSVKIEEIRQQIESDLQGLTNEIASGDYNAYPPWVYIAHSMGGLVGRVLVNHSLTKDAPVIQALQRFYLLGTPNSGSHKFAIVDRFNFLSVKAITGIFPNPDFWNFNGKSVVAYAGTSEGFTDGWVPEDSVRNIYKGNCTYDVGTGKITCTDKQLVDQSLTTITNSYEHTELGNPESRAELLIGLIRSDFCGLLPNNECGRSDCLNTNPPCNTAFASPPKLAPTTQPQVPLSNLRSIAAESLSLAANQLTTMIFRVSSTDLLTINALVSDGSASLSVVDPSNQVIDFNNLPATSGKHIVSELGEYFALRNPIPGVWSLRVTAGASGVAVSTVASENSPLGFEGFVTFPTIFTGQTGHLIGQWAGITTGITGPSVNAQVINEAGSVITTVSLFDDGNHGDNAVSDGVFGGDTPNLSTAGRYLIIFTAQGDLNGLAFARRADALLDVVASTHTLTGSFSDVAIDSDLNRTYDNIRETVGISVTSAGGYHVSADLYDAQGYFINHAIGNTQANAGGVYSVNLDFNVANVTCVQFASPFTIKHLTLADAGSLQVLDIYDQNPTSQAYDGSLFGCVSGTPAPTIISVQPNSMFPGTSGQLIISGTSFLDGAQVSFGAGVNVSSVTFGSSTTLIAQVSVSAGGVPGPRDVTITNPDGHSSPAVSLFAVASDQPPAVSINNVADQQVVNGTVRVSATASDDLGVQKVEFYVDGLLSGTDTSFPYQLVWDTSSLANGIHTLSAKAYDTANQTSQQQINVIVICTTSFAPASQSFPSGGGSGTINVSASGNCSWNAVSNAPWITITSGGGNGSGAVGFSVAANTSPSRTGTLTVAAQTFTVTQDSGCGFSLSAASQTFGSNGGTGSVNVTCGAGCNWTATSNDSWITITSGDAGIGNGTVNYSVDSNISINSRTGTITVADQTFTVNQAGIAAVGLSSFKTDFDSDGMTDIGFYRAGLWGFLKSAQSYSLASAQFFSWGGSMLQPICADFDGDGKADIAYIVPPSGGQSAAYAILQSSKGYSFLPGDVLFFPAGFPVLGDTPVVEDFDGDGKADPGIWRASEGVWIIPKSSTNYTSYIFSQWGQLGDIPVVADFDMDGKADIGFYRDGLWGVLKSGQNYSLGSAQFFSWGGAGLQPIVGDFDGDSKADIGYIVPPSGGQSAAYAILKSSTGYSFLPGDVLFVVAGFPVLGDTPVVGDFDGDGKADPGIWRESQGVWILPRSSSNYTTFIFSQWGQSGDIAFPNTTGKH